MLQGESRVGVDAAFVPTADGQREFHEFAGLRVQWSGTVNGGSKSIVGLPDLRVLALKPLIVLRHLHLHRVTSRRESSHRGVVLAGRLFHRRQRLPWNTPGGRANAIAL